MPTNVHTTRAKKRQPTAKELGLTEADFIEAGLSKRTIRTNPKTPWQGMTVDAQERLSAKQVRLHEHPATARSTFGAFGVVVPGLPPARVPHRLRPRRVPRSV